jgi:hypothetical protein
MNLIDCWVTEVLGEPYQEYGKWWLKVRGVDMGGEAESSLMFDSEVEASAVEVGYKFLH